MGKALPLELLAPAGGSEQLEAAVHFGADAVYLAGPRWGMRARADNFSDEELAAGIALAHEQDVLVYLTLNTLMSDADIDDLPAYLHTVSDLGVDAAIVGDIGAMALVRKHAPSLRIHVSTQASVMNAEAAREYMHLGASRIVLAREMTLSQIAALHKKLGAEVELEVFCHGAMCMAVSGRCLLSSQMVGLDRAANCGNCTQPCRWTWKLVEETRPDQDFGLEVDDRGSYILSANDLCMIEHLEKLAEAGVACVKIEGRNKGAYYVAATTNAYRHVIDGEDASMWRRELDATSHRPFSEGFFFGNPTQNPGHAEYDQDRTLVAVVDRCAPRADGSFTCEVICRNKAAVGNTLVALSPGHDVRTFELAEVEHYFPGSGAWVAEDNIRVNMERYRIHSPFALEHGDILCL